MSTKKKLQCGYRRPRKKAREIFDFLLTIGCNPVTIRFVRCECSSSGRAPPCQGGGSEFEPRHSLHFKKVSRSVSAGRDVFLRTRCLHLCAHRAHVKSEVRGPRESHSRGAAASSSLVTRSSSGQSPPRSRLLLLCGAFHFAPLPLLSPRKLKGVFAGPHQSNSERLHFLTGYFNTKTGRALRPAGFSFLFRTAHIILTVKNTAWTNIQPTSANIRYWHKEMPKISPSTMATAVTAQVRKVIR